MVGAFAFYGMIEFLPDWYRVKVGRKGYVRYKQTDMMAFFNTISKNDVVFLTPLIVATAPLSLPYILRRKTQGRSINAFNNRNRVVYFPLAVLRSITRHSREEGGNLSTTSLCCCFNFSLLCGYFSFSPVPQSSTIGETPKKRQFLWRGVEKIS